MRLTKSFIYGKLLIDNSSKQYKCMQYKIVKEGNELVMHLSSNHIYTIHFYKIIKSVFSRHNSCDLFMYAISTNYQSKDTYSSVY